MSKFLKLLNSVLNEEEVKTDSSTPVPMDDKQASALPDAEDVALDLQKYKSLLKSLKKAVFNAEKADLEKQREISNIDVDAVTDLKGLKSVEFQLTSFLDGENTVPENSDQYE